MQAKDVMSQPVMTVASNVPVVEAVRIMLQNKISGLPVVDGANNLVGMVTEGDLLRRTETGTLRRRPRWIEFFVGAGKLAEEYTHAEGRRVDEVMTRDVETVDETTALGDIVALMERRRIKRVPVLRGREVVGIVTRANLVRAFLKSSRPAPAEPAADTAIRERLMAHLRAQSWAPIGSIDVAVAGGIVTFAGVITDERQRAALRVAAENVPGVKGIEDQLAWVVPGGGMMGDPPVVFGPTQ